MPAAEAYQGLARKYRPQTFEDLIGQEGVADSLRQTLRQNKVAQGHLLSGPRGTGKTTTARILARALNCKEGPTAAPCGVCRHCIDIANGSDLDVVEIDGASNNGVDNIRELRERVGLSPFAARFKVYIIDEVHMLSSGAFNALLKTLEEPPPGVVFILATTEWEKVPETIRSRCAPHQFRRLTTDDIVRRLAQVAEREGIKLSPEAAREVFGPIARTVDGGMRDALMIMDQLLAMTDGQPTAEKAIQLLGLADSNSLADALDWLSEGKAAQLLGLIEELVERGRSLERFVKELVAYLRDVMLLRAGVGEGLTALTGEALKRAQDQAAAIAPATLYNILNQMFSLEERLKLSTQSRFLIEFTFLRIAEIKPVVPLDEIMNRMRSIPDASFGGGSGNPAPRLEERPAPSAQEPARREIAPAPIRSAMAAVMNDSAGGVPEPIASEGEAPEAFAGQSSEETIALLRSQLPESIEAIFGRYAGQIVRAQAEGGALRLDWAGVNALGRRMIEKPDNTRAIEAALTQIAGRPMKLVNCDAPDATPPTAPAATASQTASSSPQPARPATAVNAPSKPRVLSDSGEEIWDPDSESDDERQPFIAETANPAENHGEKRSALERAQAFLNLNEEAARRLKLMREMFQGKVIDESGRPLAL